MPAIRQYAKQFVSRGCVEVTRGSPGWHLRRGWCNEDDDLARGASLLDQSHRGCRIGQWAGPVDHRRDAAGLDEVTDLLEGLGGDLGREGLQGLADHRVEGH